MELQYLKRTGLKNYDKVLESTEELMFGNLKRTRKIPQLIPRGTAFHKNLNRRHRRLHRKIDFWRKKIRWTGCVETIIYDPNRKVWIALLFYEDGTKSYIIAPEGLQSGKTIIIGFHVPLEIGNTLPLWNIPLGRNVHNVALQTNSKGKFARAAGTSVQLLSREKSFAILRLPSNYVRLVPQTCWATIGQVSNITTRNEKIRKAGCSCWLGLRSHVRGSAINPVDHPHGGGEGRCPIGRINARTPWGKPRLGMKTRCQRKYSNVLLLR